MSAEIAALNRIAAALERIAAALEGKPPVRFNIDTSPHTETYRSEFYQCGKCGVWTNDPNHKCLSAFYIRSDDSGV